MKTIFSVVGARPQFIKLAPLARALIGRYDHRVVHTGQHFDANMSAVFFEEMGIREPDYNLHVSESRHGYQVGKMLMGLEDLFVAKTPALVVVFGDTNSTLAGALAASKLQIPILHVEAGLRSFDRAMPEEQNRVLVDHISALLSAPTQTAVDNLGNEGIREGVSLTGDLMLDTTLAYARVARERGLFQELKKQFEFASGSYDLMTIHRASNTDDPKVLADILAVIEKSGVPVLWPVHPRTRSKLSSFGLSLPNNIRAMEPQGYLEMLALLENARQVITDSGGLQKEAYFLNQPCVTVRDTTEWLETVDSGLNTLVMRDPATLDAAKMLAILNAPKKVQKIASGKFGNGDAAGAIVDVIDLFFQR